MSGKNSEYRTFGNPDIHSTIPCCTPETRKVNQALIDLFDTIVERKRATPAQGALTWLLTQQL